MPLYIPPQGVFFRLKTCPGNTTLFLGSDGSLTNDPIESALPIDMFFYDGFGPLDIKRHPADTWLWEIIPSDNSKPRDATITYKIRNKRTNTFLSLDSAAKMTADPSMITIEPSKKDHRFRLRHKNFVLYSRDDEAPRIGAVPADSAQHHNQQFEFDYQNLKFSRLVYHVKEATIQDSASLILIDQAMKNDSETEQKGIPFSCVRSLEHTSTFEYTRGITVDASFEFKAGLPVVNGESTISISNNRDWKWGTENTTTTEHKLEFPVVVAAFTNMAYHAEVIQGTLHIPFTAYHMTDSGVEVETMGIYKGASSWKLDCSFKGTELPRHPSELTGIHLRLGPPINFSSVRLQADVSGIPTIYCASCLLSNPSYVFVDLV